MTEHEILKNNQQVKLFAVSGGPDSMYMLDYYRKKYPAMKIVVAHVNYNFRADSKLDQKLVTDYCKAFNIELVIKTVPKNIYDSLEQNFEEFARNLRYDFFAQEAKKRSTNIVFVGHNQNDLVETFVLQKERQNLVNYYGLAKLSQRQDLWIYRPLLNIKKSEILLADQREQIPYRLDFTNLDQNYQRNKVRSILQESQFPTYIKEIKTLNEKLQKQTNQVNHYLKNNLQEQNLSIKKAFLNFDEAVQKRILLSYFKAIGQEELLLKRKKNTLTEILKLVVNQNKPFLKLILKDQIIVKDFDELYLVDDYFFETFSLELTGKQDLKKIKNKKWREDAWTLIKKTDQQWPYLFTNDYNEYKTKTFVKQKKTNRYFIDKKIKYKTRILNPALIKINDNQIINIKSFFKIWDN